MRAASFTTPITLNFSSAAAPSGCARLGVDQPRLRAERGLQFVVVNVTVDFLRPAVLDDEVLVTAELAKLTGATIHFKQSIWRNDAQLIDATVRAACLDSATLRPRPIPKDLFTEWRDAQ